MIKRMLLPAAALCMIIAGATITQAQTPPFAGGKPISCAEALKQAPQADPVATGSQAADRVEAAPAKGAAAGTPRDLPPEVLALDAFVDQLMGRGQRF